MPILQAELKYYLSGGPAGSTPAASIGGQISTTEIGAGLHNLFDAVSSAEAAAGESEYRCVYLKNTNGTITLENAIAWLSAEGQVNVEMGLDPAGLNGVAATPADEDTAPAGVTFAPHASEGAAAALGNMAPGDFYPIWIKRIVAVGEVAIASDSSTISFKGDYAG